MEVKYSEHIINRLKLRKIDYNLPKFIFDQSSERYYDLETGESGDMTRIRQNSVSCPQIRHAKR